MEITFKLPTQNYIETALQFILLSFHSKVTLYIPLKHILITLFKTPSNYPTPLSEGNRLFRRPQISFTFVIMFVCLGLCDCGMVALWVCGFVMFCGFMCVFVCLFLFACRVFVRCSVWLYVCGLMGLLVFVRWCVSGLRVWGVWAYVCVCVFVCLCVCVFVCGDSVR